MKIDRRHARILAMQALCQLDVQGSSFRDHVGAFLVDSDAKGKTIDYARDLVTQAWQNRERIDAVVAGATGDWSTSRLVPVDRNILRVAMVELDGGEVPPKVVINEAIEIAGEFSTAESGRFINGVLDAIWKARRAKGEK